ncbi:T6SS immunity protein Tdi1 domain-containing protein [Chitinimonas sp. BJYL2]|uniref:T6SS immunity protein Tdi1 domain-containing protein n=1 Tax=Chitinimonas sp. BJYL2 TaxID=2976696 RepID=UPI0022B4903E|nr:T6SS immunity protein Tdi1 domain-containing protein [Chitinimonas sp. BJYL2]
MSAIEAINESWGWIGIEAEEIVGENDFGNLLIRDKNGKYWRLCPEDAYCEVVAQDRRELDAISANQEFLADWYMSNLVSQAKEKLGPLLPGRKYHLAIPSPLGGAYSAENMRAVPQIEQIRFSGDIARQISTLPDGCQIELKVLK